MKNKEFMSIAQVAKLLGISRIAVYNKVKKGQIEAIRIGKAYAIPASNIGDILGSTLSEKEKAQIEKAVDKTVKEYGETLRLLGRE